MIKTANFIQEWIDEGVQQGMQQGLQQGMQQGMQQGLQQGKQQGIQQGILDVLETRFKTLPMKLIKRIMEIKESEILSSLHKKAVLVKNLEEFERIMNKVLE